MLIVWFGILMRNSNNVNSLWQSDMTDLSLSTCASLCKCERITGDLKNIGCIWGTSSVLPFKIHNFDIYVTLIT